MRKVERYINNIMIDGILVHKEKMTSKEERGSSWDNNWVKVEPKYYIDKSDDMIYEIWYNRTGIILDRGLNIYIKNDEIATDWTIANLKEINKESAMIKYKERLLREERLAELNAKDEGVRYYDKAMMEKELISYNNKNLMQRDEPKYKAGDILKVIGGHDREMGTLFKVKDCTTRYRAEDVELYTGLLTTNEEIHIYNQSLLELKIKYEEAKNSHIRGTMKSIGAKNYVLEDDLQSKQNNGGSSDFTPDYYGAKCNCGEKIDAYTICDKYAKPHKGSAWHHSLKKLIRAGDGHKALEKDIKEVIDSLNRWLEQINSQAIRKE